MATTTTDEHLRRLLDAMAEAINEKGYAATTIADVVRRARTSKRTFYEHFDDKEAAFLATFSAASDDMLAVIAESFAGDAPWRERVEAGVRAYLSELAAHPQLTRTFLIEIQVAGPRGRALRREVLQRFADAVRALVEEVRREDPGVRSISPELATAVVGGINELMLDTVEDDRASELPELTGVAVELVMSVLRA